MSTAQTQRAIALLALALLLAGPRRTRPLAGALYGLALSRAQGESRAALGDAIGETIGRLFHEKTSVGARVDRLERILSTQYGGHDLDEIERGVEHRKTDRDRWLPIWMSERKWR